MKQYPKTGKAAKLAAAALQNPVKLQDIAGKPGKIKPFPHVYPIVENPTDRIEIGWLLNAVMTILAQIQAALADDGKISAAEAWQIAMTLLNLVWELLSGKKK